ncbi:hypothetical protein SAMN04489761_1410 [Tenacibaculum sp. MAR_2009_124]|uniref:HYC_CC_PP family protein n=1 Tax=Tenacibaculum sp. MAR_2009_124 TaxID=1250059 RepID=UPI0008968F05|nr:hypothetical protein [Tenacibaculum sp. MAR_2009_124]SEB67569.1 hypothetical protein SAMN04489761_1410 [Tenacibaculum sp. MAR_2009_124]
MRILFQKISSIFLAILLILSTVSFTVEKHFCGDSLVNISFLGDVGACEDDPDDDCADSSMTIEEDSCCKNEITYLEGQHEVNKETADKSLFSKEKNVAVLNKNKLLYVCTTFHYNKVLRRRYIPPRITRNIQLLYEVFII